MTGVYNYDVYRKMIDSKTKSTTKITDYMYQSIEDFKKFLINHQQFVENDYDTPSYPSLADDLINLALRLDSAWSFGS